MKKRIIALLLMLAMVFSCLPVIGGAEELPATEISQTAYARADAVFDAIDRVDRLRATRSADQSQLTDMAQAVVQRSDIYVEGSLVRNGDAFTWMTTEGIRCAYNPRLRKIQDDMTPTESGGDDGIYNEPMPKRGGWPSGKQVYLIGPYYGYDRNFTNQYKNEAARVAAAIGDTDGYTLYSGKSATVDKVAEAVSKGAVVFFDSHGATDYENGNDYVTGATSSYLCLTSTTGLTSADYADGALYASDGIFINGATIANHMQSNSPGGILWMAICLGMATDTMCQPLREKGVEVVCGYSQSVTFDGDYLYEAAFWDKMCDGETVAAAAKHMKDTWGDWDWSTKIARYYGYSDGYSSIAAARANYTAFPVVVSREDRHPGQRNKNLFYGADSLQTVKSTYTVFAQTVYAARTENGYFETIQEAVDHAGGGYVQLLKDSTEAVTATTLRLDLNGYVLKEITVTKALYGYDSSASAQAEGMGRIDCVQGPVVPDHTVDGQRYIALENSGSYTFHTLKLDLTAVSLRTGEVGLYYRGNLACDDALRGMISGYGIALSTVDMPGVDYWEKHNLYTEKVGAPEGEFLSVMVADIFKENLRDNDQRGRTVIYANAYLTLENGDILLSDNTGADTNETVGFDGVAVSLYDMITALDQKAETLPASKLAALVEFSTRWSDSVETWGLKNLIA